jgi:hypothetical protein
MISLQLPEARVQCADWLKDFAPDALADLLESFERIHKTLTTPPDTERAHAKEIETLNAVHAQELTLLRSERDLERRLLERRLERFENAPPGPCGATVSFLERQIDMLHEELQRLRGAAEPKDLEETLKEVLRSHYQLKKRYPRHMAEIFHTFTDTQRSHLMSRPTVYENALKAIKAEQRKRVRE